MGINVAMLSEGPSAPGLHHDHQAVLELEECVHFHIREFRFTWTTEELLRLAEIFTQARDVVVGLGSPASLPAMKGLSGCSLDKSLHQDRWAVELTNDGTVHVHQKNLRTHMTQADFHAWASQIEAAVRSLRIERLATVRIDDCSWHPVSNEYMVWLEEYLNGLSRADPAAVVELEHKVRWYDFHPDGTGSHGSLQRPDGNLPHRVPGRLPRDLNQRYLAALYESIREWGYAKGPFWGRYMTAYEFPDNKVYLQGAHRTACLRRLGYETIEVFLCYPPTDSPDGAGYRQQQLPLAPE